MRTSRLSSTFLGAFLLLAFAAGCAFLRPVEVEFVSRDTVLQSITQSTYPVDPKAFELDSFEGRKDALTFQFRGKEYPGDWAWVVHFSEKGTEQDPLTLRDVYTVLPAISEGRRNFEVLDDGEVPWRGLLLRYVRYRFESEARDGAGRPLVGRGVLAALAGRQSDGWVVYRFKLDNYGDRDELGWEALLPFLEPLVVDG